MDSLLKSLNGLFPKSNSPSLDSTGKRPTTRMAIFEHGRPFEKSLKKTTDELIEQRKKDDEDIYGDVITKMAIYENGQPYVLYEKEMKELTEKIERENREKSSKKSLLSSLYNLFPSNSSNENKLKIEKSEKEKEIMMAKLQLELSHLQNEVKVLKEKNNTENKEIENIENKKEIIKESRTKVEKDYKEILEREEKRKQIIENAKKYREKCEEDIKSGKIKGIITYMVAEEHGQPYHIPEHKTETQEEMTKRIVDEINKKNEKILNDKIKSKKEKDPNYNMRKDPELSYLTRMSIKEHGQPYKPEKTDNELFNENFENLMNARREQEKIWNSYLCSSSLYENEPEPAEHEPEPAEQPRLGSVTKMGIVEQEQPYLPFTQCFLKPYVPPPPVRQTGWISMMAVEEHGQPFQYRTFEDMKELRDSAAGVAKVRDENPFNDPGMICWTNNGNFEKNQEPFNTLNS